jgi:hypothetical protein
MVSKPIPAQQTQKTQKKNLLFLCEAKRKHAKLPYVF